MIVIEIAIDGLIDQWMDSDQNNSYTNALNVANVGVIVDILLPYSFSYWIVISTHIDYIMLKNCQDHIILICPH